MVAFVEIQIAVLVTRPLPSTVVGWFRIFQTINLVVPIDMDLLPMVDRVFRGKYPILTGNGRFHSGMSASGIFQGR